MQILLRLQVRQTPRSHCPFATHTTATMPPLEGRAAPLFQKVVKTRLRTTAETTRRPAVTTRATAAPGTATPQGLQKGGGGGSPPPPQARPTPGDPRLGGGSDPGKIPPGTPRSTAHPPPHSPGGTHLSARRAAGELAAAAPAASSALAEAGEPEPCGSGSAAPPVALPAGRTLGRTLRRARRNMAPAAPPRARRQ